MKELIIETGGVALVDDEDFEKLIPYKWYENNKGYLTAVIKHVGQRGIWVLLHRFVLGVESTLLEVHHKEGNKRDNRKSMLEIMTIREHNYLRGPNKRSQSGFKGVSWISKYGCWAAHIQKGDKQKNLGHFKDKEEAARAYDRAAKQWFGERCYLNFPQI